jgi:inosine-uridine nucleoside N-ribohydrolase
MIRKLVTILLLGLLITTDSLAKKVIIDCDPGIDDAMAIILAMQYSDFEILGITTVFGNAGLEQATENALKIVELSGRKIPVYKGAERPLVIPLEKPPDFVHGVDGLGNTNWAESKLQVEPVSATEFIVEIINTHPGEITILAVGRLTNLANALALDPGIADKVKAVILMGGTLHVPGNVSPVGEANISGDPHAADLVFRASWPVTMIGLDVTTKLIMSDQILETIREENARFGNFIYDISRFYRSFHINVDGVEDGFYVHDPSAVMYLINPAIFRMKKGPVRVLTDGIGIGQTIIATYPHHLKMKAWKDQTSTSAAIEVDEAAFFETYQRIMTSE